MSLPLSLLALRPAASLLLTFTVLSYFFCLTLGIKVYSEQASSLESWFLLGKKVSLTISSPHSSLEYTAIFKMNNQQGPTV